MGSAVKSVGSQGTRIQLPIPTCWFATVYSQYLGIDAFPGHLRQQAGMWYTDMHAKHTYTSKLYYIPYCDINGNMACWEETRNGSLWFNSDVLGSS